MRYVVLGTTYKELKTIIYEVMNISQNHWNLNMSYKHHEIGVGNVVPIYYLGKINSHVDVSRMLGIPQTMQMDLGDVSLYWDWKKFNRKIHILTSKINILS